MMLQRPRVRGYDCNSRNIGKKLNQEPAIGSANPESPLLRMSYTVLMADPRGISKTFTAVLERSGDRLNWTVIRVPLDLVKILGVRGQLRVRGEINGVAFRTSLFPDGKRPRDDREQEDAGGRQGCSGNEGEAQPRAGRRAEK